MQEVLNQVPANVLVLAAALILERLFPLRENINPLSFIKAMAYGIASKVHSEKRQNAINQQKLAGTLTIPTLVLPFLFLSYTLIKVTDFPLIFDCLLMWMCLGWAGARKDALKIAKALNKQQKGLAKDLLKPWVLRDTKSLSPMGVCKSSIEMVMLRAGKDYFCVIFYYLLFGSIAMLAYRLIAILAHSYNGKLTHFKHFGKAAGLLNYYLEWLPTRLTALAVMMLGNFKLSFALISHAKPWPNQNTLWLLAATAGNLKTALGGPAMYQGVKLRRGVIGNDHTRQPEVKDIRHAINLVEKTLAVWLLFIVLIAVLLEIAKIV